jgi:hypothetical protein
MNAYRCLAIVALLSAPLVSMPAQAACKFGASGETSLQGVFDSMLGPGALDAESDCIAEPADALWQGGGAAATILIELAGFAADNVFGIYDPLDPQARQVALFGGRAGAGSSTSLAFVAAGSGFDVQTGGVTVSHFASADFGFYLRTPQQNTFFSQSSLNTDQADHMYAYQGNGDAFVGGPLADAAFATTMYLLAFEDLKVPNGDSDFQDFVAAINFMTPIPLPAGIYLLGGALALLGLSRRIDRASRECS